MRKESAFDWVVFATVARQVSDPDRDANRIAQLLQVILEQITIRSVASPAVAQQQDAVGIGVALLADAIPIPTQTIDGELARIVTEPEVNVTDVTSDVVDAVRNQLSIGPAWKIMIECLQRRCAVDSAFAIQPTKELLRFGVNREDRIAITLVLVLQFADAFKLLPAIGRVPAGNVFSDLT